MKINWTPFNGMFKDQFWDGFCNGAFKANYIMLIPLCFMLVYFNEPAIGAVFFLTNIAIFGTIQIMKSREVNEH